MPQVWKERYDWTKHGNKMYGSDGCDVEITPDPNLIPRWVYFVTVCSFTFEFHSIEQIETCLAYYSCKTHPSTRAHIGAADHWEAQRWFERLPQRLLREPKRQKVVKALTRALEEFAKKRSNR